jgi:dUTP pyrophosphatase
MRVHIQRIDKELPLPRYESAGAAGFDVITRETTVIEPRQIALVPGNVIVKVPKGFALVLVPRSSLPRRKALVCPHSVGIIDQDYHGEADELKVQVQNISDAPVTVERGERIAQGLFMRVEQAEWVEVESHGVESRGGFGSTGTHDERTPKTPTIPTTPRKETTVI